MRWLLRFLDPRQERPRGYRPLVRSVGWFALLLVGLTWRLWTPQHVFPQVPLLGFAVGWLGWLDWLGCAGMVAGWAGAAVLPEGRWSKRALLAAAASTAFLVVLDQQRLQPWAYQFSLFAVVLATARPRGAIVLVRLLIVSFYFYSALTKLDDSFLHTLGQQFLAVLVGDSIGSWSEPARLAAAAVFPLGELAVAVGLFFPRTRRVALVGAVLLHLLLLVILGPWGLDHKPGVLAWNAYFIVQDVLVFGLQGRGAAVERAEDASIAEPARPQVPWLTAALAGAAVVLPICEPWGWFDLWPSWGLYASSAGQVILQVHRREEARLDESLRPFVETSDDDSFPWLTVRIDRWALEVLGAPIYPQNRLQLGVARAVAARYGLGNRVRAIVLSPAARFTGRRDHQVLDGFVDIEAAGARYFFNTRPRRNLQ